MPETAAAREARTSRHRTGAEAALTAPRRDEGHQPGGTSKPGAEQGARLLSAAFDRNRGLAPLPSWVIRRERAALALL